MSPRARMVAGFLLANIAVAVLVALVVFSRPPSPPHIQGVLLPHARELPNFRLLDHHNQPFTNEDLKGRWSIVSYGFTTCPDVCPTTLAQLAILNRRLREQGQDELRVLFYSVDHRRDTVEQMAAYVPYFDPAFIGLTHVDDNDNPHLPFEQGLGITAQLQPLIGPDVNPADNEYEVMHGVTLFLINPQGKLQAIFDPNKNPPAGPENFDAATVLRDYLAIRQYLG